MSDEQNLITSEGDSRQFFIMLPNIIDDLELSIYAFRLYVHFVRVVGAGAGKCWQSTSTLAKACGMSRGKVSQAKKELEEAGLIAVNYAQSSAGGHEYHEVKIKNIWRANIAYYAGEGIPKFWKDNNLLRTIPRIWNEPENCSPHEQSVHDMNELFTTWTNCSRGDTKEEPLEEPLEEKEEEKVIYTSSFSKNSESEQMVDSSGGKSFASANASARASARTSIPGHEFQLLKSAVTLMLFEVFTEPNIPADDSPFWRELGEVYAKWHNKNADAEYFDCLRYYAETCEADNVFNEHFPNRVDNALKRGWNTQYQYSGLNDFYAYWRDYGTIDSQGYTCANINKSGAALLASAENWTPTSKGHPSADTRDREINEKLANGEIELRQADMLQPPESLRGLV